MNARWRHGWLFGLLLLWNTAGASAQQQEQTQRSTRTEESPTQQRPAASGLTLTGAELPARPDQRGLQFDAGSCCSTWNGGPVCDCRTNAGLHAGAEFLLIRPHFSEAVAFAQGSQTPASIHTRGRELDFDYEASPRLFVGYRSADRDELRFTYWHFQGDVSINGSAATGEFIVDPFGNVVGAVAVVDPRDGRFVPPPPFGTGPTILVGGDFIHTKAVVETNVYDLEYRRPFTPAGCRWCLDWSAGVRIADVNQFYEAIISNAGALQSRGDFGVDFVGAGPRVGLEARRLFASDRFSVFARTDGSLLLGEYDVRFSNQVAQPFPFQAGQQQSLTRTIPVLETELGASWQPTQCLTLSAGWLFQAWFDMGTSGGHFGGFFTGADDANIMSFDGLTFTVELTF